MSNQRISISTGTSAVYGHFVPGEKKPFYIGHGSMDAGRPFRGGRWRTQSWRQYVTEIGGIYEVHIFAVYETKREAQEHERRLLAKYEPVVNANSR